MPKKKKKKPTKSKSKGTGYVKALDMVGRKGNGSQNFVVFLTVKELDMKKFAFFF